MRIPEKEYGHLYYLNHKQIFSDKAKQYYQLHKEEVKRRASDWYYAHKELIRDAQVEYRRANADKINAAYKNYVQTAKGRENKRRASANYNQRIRDIVFNHYGNKCAECGETVRGFLTMDHINNDGASLRKEQGSGVKLYQWIIKHNFPNDFQILCWNHNCSKPYNTELKQSKTAIANRKSYQKLKRDAIFHYGDKCECCGESDIKYLTIDHPKGDGAEHRRTMGTDVMYRWLKQNNYPDGYKILCFNCNAARAFNNGVCPHKEESLLTETTP